MKTAAYFMLGTFLTVFTLFAESIPIALLSVATEVATLDLARPESQRPRIAIKPLPYAEDYILKLDNKAQAHALEANERTMVENELSIATAIQSDRHNVETRERLARSELAKSDLGMIVLKIPEFFPISITNGFPFALLHSDEEGFVKAPVNALFMRLFFGDLRFNPQPAPLPNISNEPITLTLPVSIKLESPTGESLFFETFDQKMVVANSDALLGKKKSKPLTEIVRAAVGTSVKKAYGVAMSLQTKNSLSTPDSHSQHKDEK